MNYLKSSLVGFAATAALLAGAGIASAQVVDTTAYGNTSTSIVVPTGSSQTVTAIGSAASPGLVITGPVVSAMTSSGLPVTLIPTTSGYVPASYTNYYNLYGTANANPYNLMTSNYAYPGAPNTGGPVNANVSTAGSAAASASLNNTGTYLPPSYVNSIGGVTGGISVPAGYSVAFGPYGNLVSTNSNTSINGSSGTTYVYPGAPNTGGPISASGGFVANGSFVNSNGAIVNIGSNGLIRLTGVVSTVTPNALGVNAGNQTWTVRWNSGTSVSSASGINSVTGAQIGQGDLIEVDGYLDQTYVSQIDATSIRDISANNL